jgi:calcium-dependent protein kinase
MTKNMASEEEQRKLINEVAILRQLVTLKNQDHPNIIKMYEFYQDAKNFYIVTDYCEGGQLFEYVIGLGYICERTARLIMQQVISAVKRAVRSSPTIQSTKTNSSSK